MNNGKSKKKTHSVVTSNNQATDPRTEALEFASPLIDSTGTGSKAARDEIAEDRTTCAVQGCTFPTARPTNLCEQHRLPGAVVSVNNRTIVITAWAVEHGDESGIILLNDFALGDLFGGRAGFEKRLREQGFTGISNIRTPDELESAKRPPSGKKLGRWGGPWLTSYTWEIN